MNKTFDDNCLNLFCVTIRAWFLVCEQSILRYLLLLAVMYSNLASDPFKAMASIYGFASIRGTTSKQYSIPILVNVGLK